MNTSDEWIESLKDIVEQIAAPREMEPFVLYVSTKRARELEELLKDA